MFLLEFFDTFFYQATDFYIIFFIKNNESMFDVIIDLLSAQHTEYLVYQLVFSILNNLLETLEGENKSQDNLFINILLQEENFMERVKSIQHEAEQKGLEMLNLEVNRFFNILQEYIENKNQFS